MAIMATPIHIQVVSHSFPFPILSPIPITMGIPWDSHSHWESHSHGHWSNVTSIYCRCVFFWHFAAPCLLLRGAAADCSEILTHDCKCVHLDNVGPEIWGSLPQKISGQLLFLHLGAKSPSSVGRSPWKFAKWREIGGFRSYVQIFGRPVEKMWEAKWYRMANAC